MEVELLDIAKHVHVQPHCSDETEDNKDYVGGDEGDGLTSEENLSRVKHSLDKLLRKTR